MQSVVFPAILQDHEVPIGIIGGSLIEMMNHGPSR